MLSLQAAEREKEKKLPKEEMLPCKKIPPKTRKSTSPKARAETAFTDGLAVQFAAVQKEDAVLPSVTDRQQTGIQYTPKTPSLNPVPFVSWHRVQGKTSKDHNQAKLFSDLQAVNDQARKASDCAEVRDAC